MSRDILYTPEIAKKVLDRQPDLPAASKMLFEAARDGKLKEYYLTKLHYFRELSDELPGEGLSNQERFEVTMAHPEQEKLKCRASKITNIAITFSACITQKIITDPETLKVIEAYRNYPWSHAAPKWTAWTFNPIIFSIGPLALRWYSLVYVLGFLLAYWLLYKAAEKKWIKNLDKQGVEDLMVSLIIWSVVVMRLVYVIIYNPSYYLAEPWKIIFLWEGGVSFHGGFLGAIIAGWLFCRKRKVSFFALADLLVVPFSLVLAFGRIANFINAELVGRVTNVSWCINYPNHPQIVGCRHPSQFYESGKNLLMFLGLGLVYVQKDVRKRLREGTFFWSFIIIYGIGRFLTDFYRAPDPTDFTLATTGLIVGQWLSLIMAAIGVVGLVWLYWQKNKKKTTKK